MFFVCISSYWYVALYQIDSFLSKFSNYSFPEDIFFHLGLWLVGEYYFKETKYRQNNIRGSVHVGIRLISETAWRVKYSQPVTVNCKRHHDCVLVMLPWLWKKKIHKNKLFLRFYKYTLHEEQNVKIFHFGF